MGFKQKSSRARSQKAKEDQFQLILKKGQKMFLTDGTNGFSMRKLARKLEMGENSASSLYTYISSKRELWFAIIRQEFQKFEQGIIEILNSHPGNAKEKLIAIAHFYIDFAFENPRRYRMMFRISAPKSKNIGPIEQNYSSSSVMMLSELVSQAISNNQFADYDVGKLSFFLWGILHGPINVIDTELFGDRQKQPQFGNRKEYFAFIKDIIVKIVNGL